MAATCDGRMDKSRDGRTAIAITSFKKDRFSTKMKMVGQQEGDREMYEGGKAGQRAYLARRQTPRA